MSWEWLDPATQIGSGLLGIIGTLAGTRLSDQRAMRKEELNQRRLERQDRQKAYARFLAQDQKLVEIWGRASDGDRTADVSKALMDLRSIAGEIELIAPDATFESIQALMEAWQHDAFFSSDAKAQDAAGVALVPLRKVLMQRMRQEFSARDQRR